MIIFSVDLDNCLLKNKFCKDSNVDTLAFNENLMQSLKECKIKYNLEIIINTCRTGKYLLDAVNFLLEANFPFSNINEQHKTIREKYKGSEISRKLFCHFSIDDTDIFFKTNLSVDEYNKLISDKLLSWLYSQ
jgi:hypothetical protein